MNKCHKNSKLMNLEWKKNRFKSIQIRFNPFKNKDKLRLKKCIYIDLKSVYVNFFAGV